MATKYAIRGIVVNFLVEAPEKFNFVLHSSSDNLDIIWVVRRVLGGLLRVCVGGGVVDINGLTGRISSASSSRRFSVDAPNCLIDIGDVYSFRSVTVEGGSCDWVMAGAFATSWCCIVISSVGDGDLR